MAHPLTPTDLHPTLTLLHHNPDFATPVLLPENLRAYFELSAQAWILYKAPQWNARYPNSCPERIKLKMH
jgi:hypothetical protein